MSAWSRIFGAGLLLGALHVAPGCNSVLGIEQATLDTATATCETGRGLSLAVCELSTSCESCVSNSCSQTQIRSCLDDSECRKALANYRTCQRDDCTDPVGGCAGCLEGGVGAECFADCADDCQRNELWSLCDIFCSCMDKNCTGVVDPAACRMACRDSGAPWRTNCFLTHCELATGPSDDHCLHASDQLEVCPTTPPVPDANCEPGERQIGYGCDSNDQCCSKFCRNKSCQF